MRKLKVLRTNIKKNDGAVEDAIKVAAQVCKECNSALSQIIPLLAKSQEKDPQNAKKIRETIDRIQAAKGYLVSVK